MLQRDPDRQIAVLALLLLDAGMLRDVDMQRRRTQLPNACRKSVEAWVAQQCAGLRIFKPKLSIRVGTRNDAATPFVLHIEWHTTDAQFLVIGPSITRLEETHRCLGGTAMQLISSRGWCSIPVFTFDNQIDVASHTQWGGTASIDEYIYECGLDTEEADEMRESCIDRVDIVEHTPEWVFSLGSDKLLEDVTLKRIAKRSADPLSRAVASAIIALRAAPEPYDYLRDAMENDGEFVGFGAVLRWSADDYTPAVLETLWEQAQNSGEGFEACGYHEQIADDVEGLRGWMANLAVTFRTVRLLDQLIWLLAEFSNESSRP